MQRFFLKSKAHVQDIQGTDFNFYPNRIVSLSNVDELSTDVIKAIKVLFDRPDDRASIVKRQSDGEFNSEEIATDAPEPAVLEVHHARADAAIQTLVQAICARKSQVALGALLMDSMRDEFPYKRQRGVADIEDWLYGTDNGEWNGLSVPQMVDIVKGWLAANASQFGDQGKKLAAAFRSFGQPDAAPQPEPQETTGEESNEES